MTTTTPILLNSGATIPPVGFGTWQVGQKAVAAAATAGYGAFDTASMYRNEAEVARGIGDAGRSAADMFITTKVWTSEMGYDATLRAFERSRRLLNLDVVDLYLVHWPQRDKSLMTETWRALEALYERGSARSIGVSNFDEEELDLLARHSGVTPAINQIALNPLAPRTALVAANTARGIVTTAHSPLGSGGGLLRHHTLTALAKAHGVTAAQIVLRWLLQKQIVSIPRSSNAGRIAQNIDLDTFELSPEGMAQIDRMAA